MLGSFEVFTNEDEARGVASSYEERGFLVTVGHCAEGYVAKDETEGVYPEAHSVMSNANDRWVVLACPPD